MRQRAVCPSSTAAAVANVDACTDASSIRSSPPARSSLASTAVSPAVRTPFEPVRRTTSTRFDGSVDDREAGLYMWDNRRECAYAAWAPMGYRADRPSILRWYGARAARRAECPERGVVGGGAGVVVEAYDEGATQRGP